MSITAITPPARTGGSGRNPRLSRADLEKMSKLVSGGKFASDGETVEKKSTATSRAQSARNALLAAGIETSSRIWPDDGGFRWAIGPKAIAGGSDE